jgi:hypothetical protein
MLKPFLSILWGTALLIFSCRCRRLVYAATPEQESEAEYILKAMEEQVKDLCDEIERVDKGHC